jgi:hypothetical protein
VELCGDRGDEPPEPAGGRLAPVSRDVDDLLGTVGGEVDAVAVRVLVTGGAGYIGATTAASVLDAGHEVTVADDLSRGHRDAVPRGGDLRRGGRHRPERIDAVVADGGFDACLHFAALIEAGESMRTPERFFR